MKVFRNWLEEAYQEKDEDFISRVINFLDPIPVSGDVVSKSEIDKALSLDKIEFCGNLTKTNFKMLANKWKNLKPSKPVIFSSFNEFILLIYLT